MTETNESDGIQSPQRHIAVYWDFENIHLSCANVTADKSTRSYGKQPHLVKISALMRYIQSIGLVSLSRAYADWTTLGAYARDFQQSATELVQLFSATQTGKNGADIRMSLDILADANQFPHIDTVVIIAGDSDYLALVQKLRARGVYVIGIGKKGSVAGVLLTACDEFKLYDSIVGDTVDESADSLEQTCESGLSAKGARILLDTAFARLEDERGGVAPLASVRPMMIRINGTFDQANFGYQGPGSFKRFVQEQGGYVIDGHILRKTESSAPEGGPPDFAARFSIGDKLCGKVVNILPYGVFVEIAPGFNGLVHETNMSWNPEVEDPNDLVNIGEKVDVVVLGIDTEKKQIELGMKQCFPDPWEIFNKTARVGAQMSGQICKVLQYGSFVKTADSVSGLLHRSQSAQEWVDNKNPYVVGQKIAVRILYFEAKTKKLIFSEKAVKYSDKKFESLAAAEVKRIQTAAK
jgi:predicted RNA-binding protein with RPS1 domain